MLLAINNHCLGLDCFIFWFQAAVFGRGRDGWQPEMGFALSTACLQAVR